MKGEAAEYTYQWIERSSEQTRKEACESRAMYGCLWLFLLPVLLVRLLSTASLILLILGTHWSRPCRSAYTFAKISLTSCARFFFYLMYVPTAFVNVSFILSAPCGYCFQTRNDFPDKIFALFVAHSSLLLICVDLSAVRILYGTSVKTSLTDSLRKTH